MYISLFFCTYTVLSTHYLNMFSIFSLLPKDELQTPSYQESCPQPLASIFLSLWIAFSGLGVS